MFTKTSQFQHRNGQLKIEAKKCPKDSTEFKQEIHLFTKKSFQNLTLDIELLCSCPCEKQAQPNHIQCAGRGTLKCGICECDYGFGKNCECDEDPSDCLYKNLECSGRGNCVCGVCLCEKRLNPEEVFLLVLENCSNLFLLEN